VDAATTSVPGAPSADKENFADVIALRMVSRRKASRSELVRHSTLDRLLRARSIAAMREPVSAEFSFHRKPTPSSSVTQSTSPTIHGLSSIASCLVLAAHCHPRARFRRFH
jgi:hypothetical protein